MLSRSKLIEIAKSRNLASVILSKGGFKMTGYKDAELTLSHEHQKCFSVWDSSHRIPAELWQILYNWSYRKNLHVNG